MNREFVLEMEHIGKIFRNIPVLSDVNLQVKKGTVHALMGENGAGKSTLMKILMGIYQKDSGEIRLSGETVSFASPRDAMDKGVAMIHQELAYVGELPIYENIFLGREYRKRGGFLLDFPRMKREASQLLKKVRLDLPVTTPMGSLTVAQAQMVEIAKAISFGAEVIIMDEPTSAISDEEVEVLFSLIHELVDEGKSVIYITHKMDEVFRIADEITVLRDGQWEGCFAAKDITQEQLIRLMVNRELSDMFPPKNNRIGEEILRVEGLNSGRAVRDVSFQLRRGEILGFSGLLGSGRTETVECLFGIRKKNTGSISIKGRELTINSPRDAIANGMGMVTEDRKKSGVILPMSIQDNVLLVQLKRLCRFGFLRNQKNERKTAAAETRQLNVKMSDLGQLAQELSGGNQQKLILSKWLLSQPDILILDEPTRGIDVGAKAEIYRLITLLAEQGKSIIMISSEMPEIIGLSDRVVVFCDNTISGILDREALSQEAIMNLSVKTL